MSKKRPDPDSPARIGLTGNSIDDAEVQAIARVFETKWLINGPEVAAFEEEFAIFVGAEQAVAVTSCTAGMHLCLAGLGIGPGDEVILPAFNFVAAGIPVMQVGAQPVFADVGNDGNLDVADLERRITPRTRAVLVLHYAGCPVDLQAVLDICTARGISVVEDAAHALGSLHRGRMIGGQGTTAVFSFGPSKHLVTGMGGMVTTGNENLAQALRSLRTYGMEQSRFDRHENERPWNYAVDHLGHNFRMTDITAAMGRVQLGKVEDIVRRRRELAAGYVARLAEVPGITVLHDPAARNSTSSFLYFVARLTDAEGRDSLVAGLNEAGINASVHWAMPLNRLGMFAGHADTTDLPNAGMMADSVITLPLHQNMTPVDLDRVVTELRRLL